MSNQIVYPTFSDAQQLYAQYSTIEKISVLHSNLFNTIDASFLSTMADENIHKIYNKIILKYYPNEICIKSSFIKQVLMHGKNHVTIFELPVGTSRADLCKINGESIAYEIKTDLDNFARLQKQINDYYKIFEKVFVICSESNVSKIIQLIPQDCGVYCYRQNRIKNYKFTLVRDALLRNNTIALNQLNIIRKDELKLFFSNVSSLQKRTEMIDYILQHYSSEKINQIFKIILKKRFQKQWLFLKDNQNEILEIDYQWFFKNPIDPSLIYEYFI